MVVRFLPVARDTAASAPQRDRADLAEVIELRSRLNQDRPDQDRLDQDRLDPDRLSVARAELSDIEEAISDDKATSADISHERVSSAESDAVRLLARRARSSGELRRELQALGHSSVEVDGVIFRCEANLYLDDLGLARVLTENLRDRKRASRSQIRMKLR